MCARRQRQQRGIIATALLASLQEYQERRSTSRALPPTGSRGVPHTQSFQEPMIQGVTYMAPQYHEPVDPNPPAYEEATGQSPSVAEQPQYPSIADEKRQLYRLSTEEQVPPHVHANYQPNTGLDTNAIPQLNTNVHDSVPRSVPVPTIVTPVTPVTPAYSPHPTTSTSRHHESSGHSNIPSNAPNAREVLAHLLESIAIYYDTQMKLNADKPSKVRQLEHKKERKLEKAEKKFNEHLAKGKDTERSEAKLAKRAEKMDKWTEWVLKKNIERDEKWQQRDQKWQQRAAARGRGCPGQVPVQTTSHV
ncbi:hypothetical protein TWF694_003267 [Orbilia ellipsospora]|uniref:Uncharacterized protein n=1 Tax=Orbilia ellipsospora TaxID=2528407 RepID=A0AAV9X134_9PEZI